MERKRIVVFGATSSIAHAYLRAEFESSPEVEFFLVARNQEKLDAIAADLRALGAQTVKTSLADLAQPESHTRLFQTIDQEFPNFNIALVAYGSLSDQKACQADYARFVDEFRVNFLSVVSLAMHIRERYEKRSQRGSLVVISSVAGDRGRKSNYVYGSAKGALSLYLQGLRNELCEAGIHVLTVKPGFVDTPMTEHLPKGKLFVQPEVIGRGIQRAVSRRAEVVYLPWFWRIILLVIRAIPESLFKRLSI